MLFPLLFLIHKKKSTDAYVNVLMYLDSSPFYFFIMRLTCHTLGVDDHCVCRQKKWQSYLSTFLVLSD